MLRLTLTLHVLQLHFKHFQVPSWFVDGTTLQLNCANEHILNKLDDKQTIVIDRLTEQVHFYHFTSQQLDKM